jgi:copper(I)-binding protein
MPRVILSLLLAAIVAPALSLAQPASIQVEQGWARATPGKSTRGAAYVTIVSPTDDRLVAAASPVATQVQIHEQTMDNGVMKMRQLDAIDVHAGKKLVLAPNGFHLMLIGLTQPLVAGQSFPLTLTFEKAGAVETQILVKKLGSPDAGDGMQGMHM